MDSMDFQLRLKPVMDVSDISGSVQQLQQYLNKLNLPPKLKGEFKSTFIEVENKVASIQQKLDSGFKTKGDVTGLEKEFKNLDILFKQLSSKLQGLDASKFKGITFNTPEIKEAKQQIVALQEQLNKQLPTGMMDKVSQSIKALGITSKTQSSVVKSFYNALQSGNVQEATNQLELLKNKVKETSDSSAELKNMTTLLDQLKNSGVVKTTEDLRAMEQVLLNLKTEELNKLQQRLLQGADGAEQLRQGIRGVGEQSRASANDMYSMTNQMDQLKHRVQYFFSLTNSVMLFRRALRSAFNSVKELDTAMKETAVVTDFSIDDMWKTLPQRTEDAKKLGVAIKDVYEARTLYYQQGLKTAEVDQLSTKTLQLARIAGLEAADATDRMTSALRGFNMELNETSAERVADVYANLAAKTASDTDEISNAMSKTASIAANAGMEFETTSAFLAQMIETTREAPENLGTAMKTIIARFTEMKKSPTDVFTDLEGEEVSVNKVDSALRSVGVSLKDVNGQFRDTDDVFLELAEKWDTLDKNTQRYIATTAAGSRQQSRFIAMMSNYERTMELVGYANNSAGAAQKQYEKTLDSLETKLQNLKNAWQQFITTIANSELIKIGVDMLTLALEAVNKFIDILPDGTEALGAFLLAFVAFKGLGGLFNAGMTSIFTLANPLISNSGYQHGVMYGLAFNKGAKSTGMPIGGTPNVKGSAKNANAGLFRTMIQSGKQSKTGFWSGAKQGYNSWIYGGKQDINGRWHDIKTGQFMKTGKGGKPALTAKAASVSKIGGIAATIAGTAWGTSIVKKGFNDAIDTSEEKISRYNEVLSELNGLIQENQSLFDNYDSAKDSYEEITEKLNSLTSGTADWTKALMEVNDQNKQILAKYPELIKYTKEINGATILTEEGWTQYNSLLQKDLVNQRTAAAGMEVATMAEEHRNRAGNIVDTKDITNEEYKNIDTATTIGGVAGGALGGWALGAALGSVIPVFGTIIGGLIGGLAGALIGGGAAGGVAESIASNGITSEQASEAARIAQSQSFFAETATEAEVDKFIKSLEDAGIATDGFKEAIENNAVEFDEFVASTAEYDIAAEAQRDATISEIAAGMDITDDDREIVTTWADLTQDDYDKKVEEYYNDLDLSVEELKEQYSDLTGLTSDEINAKLEEKSLSEDTMKTAIAGKMATDDLTEAMEGTIKKFANLDSATQTLIKRFLGVGGSGLTAKDLDQFTAPNQGKKGDISYLKDLQNRLNSEDSEVRGTALAEVDANLANMGTTLDKLNMSAEEVVNQMLNTANIQNNLYKNLSIGKTETKNAVTSTEESITKKGGAISVEGKQGLVDTFQNAFREGGESNITKIQDIFEGILAKTDSEDVNAVSELLAKMDTSDTNSIEAALLSIKDYTPEIDTNDLQAAIEENTGAIDRNTTAQTNEKTTKNNQAIDIINEILTSGTGKVITEDQKKKLIDTGVVTESDFTPSSRGEGHTYTGKGGLSGLRLRLGGKSSEIISSNFYKSTSAAAARGDIVEAEEAEGKTDTYRKDTTVKGEKTTESKQPGQIVTYSTPDTTSDEFGTTKTQTRKTVISTSSTSGEEGQIKKEDYSSSYKGLFGIGDYEVPFGNAYVKRSYTDNQGTDRVLMYDQDGNAQYATSDVAKEYFADNKNIGVAEDGTFGYLSEDRKTSTVLSLTGAEMEGLKATRDNAIVSAENEEATAMIKMLSNYLGKNWMKEDGSVNTEALKTDEEYGKFVNKDGSLNFGVINTEFNNRADELGYGDTVKNKTGTKESIQSTYQAFGSTDSWAAAHDNIESDEETGKFTTDGAGFTTTDTKAMDTLMDEKTNFYNESGQLNDEGTAAIDAQKEALSSLGQEYDVSQKVIDDYAAAVEGYKENVSDGTKQTLKEKKAVLDNAIAHKKAVKNLKQHVSELKDITDEYEGAKKGTAGYEEKIDKLGEAFGFSSEQMEENGEGWQFVTDNMSLIEQAANGDVDALRQLQSKLAESYGFTVDANGNFTGLEEGARVSAEAIKKLVDSGYYKTETITVESEGNYMVPIIEDGLITGYESKPYKRGQTITTIVPADQSALQGGGGGSSGGGGGGGGGGSSTPQKNTKKEWQFNREKKSEKRDNKMAKIEHKIAMEQTKQIPNLQKLNKLNKQRLDLLTKQLNASKDNTAAAEKEAKRLWNQAKKKGYDKFINKDGTITSKYNDHNWGSGESAEKKKEAFDEWESDYENIQEYLQAQKESTLEYEEQIAEIKNARSEFTALTNLSAKMEASQSRLNNLQSEYNTLLSDSTTSSKKLFGNLIQQTAELNKQVQLQKVIEKQNRSEAKRRFKKNELGQYFKSYNFETGEYVIDYKAINTAVKEGSDRDAIDETINGFIEYMQGIQDSNVEQVSLQEQIAENTGSQMDTYISLQERIRDAIIQERQDQIDLLSNIDSSINETNSKILSEIREGIQDSRQARQNEEKEEDLADKQNRLAYLKQYSGGGNAVEIAKLEEEIEKGQQSYTDTLIDQKLSIIEEQNNEASEQRQRQIAIMQKQLEVDQENGRITDQVEKYCEDIVNGKLGEGSSLYKLLSNTDNLSNMTDAEFESWSQELKSTISQSAAYMALSGEKVGTKDSDKKKGSSITFQDASGNSVKGTVGSDGKVNTTGAGGVDLTYSDVKGSNGNYATSNSDISASGQITLTNSSGKSISIYDAAGNEIDKIDNTTSTYGGGAYKVTDYDAGTNRYQIQYWNAEKQEMAAGWVNTNPSNGTLAEDTVKISKGDIVLLNNTGKAEAKKVGHYGMNGHEGWFYVESNDGKGTLTLKDNKDSSNGSFKIAETNATLKNKKEAKTEKLDTLKYINDVSMKYKFLSGIKLDRKGSKENKFDDASNDETKTALGQVLQFRRKNASNQLIFRKTGKKEDEAATWRTKNPENKVTKIKQYKTGGLADFTGPAWLDGTKTKPEIILNQKDTENFIQLKNILADIMKGVPSKSNQNNGDSYAEIHINVEKMTSDYDVDQVAKRVKKILNEDGRYRTVNQINRLR